MKKKKMKKNKKKKEITMNSLVLGRYDNPEEQLQDDYEVDLYQSNIAVFGTAMSGKTTLLKTLLIRIHQVKEAKDMEEIYILDFNNGLQMYGKLPYVKACFDGANDENVRRIFKIIEGKFSEYSKILSGKVYSQCPVDERPPHITFVLDGLNSFYTDGKYESYKELLLKLSRDGLAKGITLVFAANEYSGGIGRLMGAFNRVIAFDLPKDKYAEIFSAKVEKPILEKGRGVANSEKGVFEFQAYYPYDYSKGDGEEKALEIFIENLKEFYEVDVEKAAKERLKTFITDLNAETWSEYMENEPENPAYQKGCLTVGLDYFKFKPISINLEDANAIAIYGKKRSGKSNLLRLILYGALGISGVRFVFWEDKRSGLDDVKDIVKQDIITSFPEIGSPQEKPNYPSWKLIKNKEEFFAFIEEEAYYDIPKDMYEEEEKKITKKEHPFTVFVIQSKQFYLSMQGRIGTQVISRLAAFINSASEEKVLFVFSDAQNITESEIRLLFNNSIKYAFLLDDIVRFIRDNKGQHTVFGTQDLEELKEMFGKCERGDGYLLDIEQSDEVVKFKMLNVSHEKMLRNETIEEKQIWKEYRILDGIGKGSVFQTIVQSDEKKEQKAEISKPREEEEAKIDKKESTKENVTLEDDDDAPILPIYFKKKGW